MSRNRTTGFTLIELSIVLVIIGLVIGGMMAGRDLIKAAQRRAQLAQFEMFQVAVSTFKVKYNQLAGDANNATEFFTGVTNGNGNGILQLADSTSRCDIGIYGGEMGQFFIHLSKANLLDHNYTGGSAIDSGYPSLRIKPEIGMVATSNNGRQQLRLCLRIVNPTIMPNLDGADTIATADSNALNGEETMFMDMKADDGRPARGRFTADTESAFSGAVNPCNDGTNYYWNVSTSRCRPSFDLQF
jgi:prepilin-type N-terminal cleavage/methylation domain-containing protein